MSDEFFEDEAELMGEPAAPDDAKSQPASAPSPARHEAPPFWMVLAIAAIALVLGVVIGYLLGTQATLAELGNSSAAMARQQSQPADSAPQLPEGHPQLSIDEDGTARVAE